MGRLSNKIALITGGTSGIGTATARLCQKEGATVIVTGSSLSSVEAARGELPGIEVLFSDAGSPTAAITLVEYVGDKYGRIDILFINAGISRLTKLDTVEESAFDLVFNVNFRGPYFLLKHAVPVISDGGSIILTSSAATIQGIPGLNVYSASKAALRSLGTTLAVELAPQRIRVNTVTPGFINTPFGSKVGAKPEEVAHFGPIVAKTPLGRIGDPEEIAEAALYFASDASRFTTGAELRVDGGMTLV